MGLAPRHPGPGQAATPSTAPSAPVGGFSGRKLTCRQIGSLTRAQELLRQGHTYLNKNGEGGLQIPAVRPARLGEPQGPVPLMGYGHEAMCMNENYLQHLQWMRLA